MLPLANQCHGFLIRLILMIDIQHVPRDNIRWDLLVCLVMGGPRTVHARPLIILPGGHGNDIVVTSARDSDGAESPGEAVHVG